MYVKWSQDQCIRDNVSKIEIKEKIQEISLHPSYKHSPISYTNLPHMSMTTLISKLLPLFVMSDKGQVNHRHLIITWWAIIIILSIINTIRAIITLILKCLGRRRGSHCETTHHNLSSRNTTDMGVHLTQLIAKSVKVSIHAHKLCHDGLKCHPTRWRRKSEGGWGGRSQRSYHLCLGLPRSQLCYALSNSSCIYGTHIVGRLKIEDEKMANEPRDSRRKNELIMSRRILIYIYKREYKVWRDVNREILNEG